MNACNLSCHIPSKPSGHTSFRQLHGCNIAPISFPSKDYETDYSKMPTFKNFAGPYKDYHPPGDRTPAVGEKIWGDVPYLPSYLDPMYAEKTAKGQTDNLYSRGPFYPGVSETHTEFVNRGVLPPRQYHEYVRHYEEPGMRDEKSVTHTDYTPPHPMLPRDKTPCLKEEPPKTWYEPEIKAPKNPHAKEHVVRPQETQVVYVDDEDGKRDFSTEHNDNYVCYHRPKTESKIKDPIPVPEEIFLKNVREGHQNCTHSEKADDVCDGSCKIRQQCPGATQQRTSWLLHPKNYAFRNGIMLIPCKCRYDES